MALASLVLGLAQYQIQITIFKLKIFYEALLGATIWGMGDSGMGKSSKRRFVQGITGVFPPKVITVITPPSQTAVAWVSISATFNVQHTYATAIFTTYTQYSSATPFPDEPPPNTEFEELADKAEKLEAELELLKNGLELSRDELEIIKLVRDEKLSLEDLKMFEFLKGEKNGNG